MTDERNIRTYNYFSEELLNDNEVALKYKEIVKKTLKEKGKNLEYASD